MSRWTLPFFLLFFLSFGLRGEELPRPLPDDPYPREPAPEEPPRGVEIPYSLGSGETGRFGSRTSQFFPRSDLNRVIRLRLIGLRNTIEVKEIKLLFADNSEERNELTLVGDLKPGEVREAFLAGRSLYRIEVVASASFFWKKPGSYRVDITAVR